MNKLSDHPRLLEEFADLTDWQIVHLYVIPAADRAEQINGSLNPAAAPKPDDQPQILSKANVVGLLMSRGWPKGKAEQEYEKQLALTLKKREGK